jgi:hypothetical protein
MATTYLVIENRPTGDRILATVGNLGTALKERDRRYDLAGKNSPNAYQVMEKAQFNLVKKHYDKLNKTKR